MIFLFILVLDSWFLIHITNCLLTQNTLSYVIRNIFYTNTCDVSLKFIQN
jgi:hypothetical protein